MSDRTIQEIELNIQQAQKFIDDAKALERLLDNRDFKRVIMDGYFEKTAVRLVHLKSDPAMQTAEHQASIIAQMDAIGALNHYFRNIAHQAMLAEKAIEADEETRDELLEEGL